MSSRLPSYLTRNFHGIFVFQYRSSNQLRSIHPQFQLLFRRSLFTRDKREALRKAKLWTIVMDELSALLNDPESYGRAVGGGLVFPFGAQSFNCLAINLENRSCLTFFEEFITKSLQSAPLDPTII